MKINGEELKELYLLEAGRDLTDVDIEVTAEEARRREKLKQELRL